MTPQIPDHTVAYGERDGEDVADVAVLRTFDGDVDDVWDALTSPERLPRWFAPVSGDLRRGGRYAIEGNASGTVTECHPPRGFSLTWEFGGATSWLEVEVAEASPGRTIVRITHTCPVDADHWRQFGPSAVGLGWDLTIAGLGMHLAGGDGGGDVYEAGLAWMSSPDGVGYLRSCGATWAVADLAAGVTREDAETRARASVEAFTAPPA